MTKSYRNEILLGVFFFLVLGLLIGMFHVLGGGGMRNRISISARFDSASGLVADNYVMVAGVPVGTVERISVDHDRALVEMRIDPDAGIRRDALARIRAKSLLGEKFVELTPRSPDAPQLKEGDCLEQTETPMEVDQVFTALRPFFEKMEPMAPKIDGLLGELETLISQLNETGKSRRETLLNIIDNADRLLVQSNRILSDNEGRIGRAADRAEKLTETLSRRAPELLEKAGTTLARLNEAAKAVPVETLRKIPDAYAKADRVLDHTLGVVERMDRSGKRIERILKNLDILLQRVGKIDELTIRKFVQEEGVNINLTQDAASRKRIEELEREVKTSK